MMGEAAPSGGFQIFRGMDAPTLEEAKIMSISPFTEAQRAGLVKVNRASETKGSESRVLFNLPGFSLVHAWFKADYPLALHTHDSDCLYYVVAGTLKLGKEWLGARDGFFIPASVPYTYTPGPEGVEVLEFRHATQFDFRLLSKGEGYWDRAAARTAARSEDWAKAQPPGAKPLSRT